MRQRSPKMFRVGDLPVRDRFDKVVYLSEPKRVTVDARLIMNLET